MEVKFKVTKINIVKLYCDKCNEEMVAYEFLPSNPSQYQFKCPKCNNCIITDKNYPYQEIEYAIEDSEKGV